MMTSREWASDCRKFAEQYKAMEKWDIEQINYYDGEIEYLGREIAKERKACRDIVKRVWAQGVLTRFEMAHYSDPAKYKSNALEKLLKERRQAYRWRKYCREQAERERAQVAYWESKAAYWESKAEGSDEA